MQFYIQNKAIFKVTKWMASKFESIVTHLPSQQKVQIPDGAEKRERNTDLWSKALNVILFLFQNTRWNKKREVAILNFHFLDFCIKEYLQIDIIEIEKYITTMT